MHYRGLEAVFKLQFPLCFWSFKLLCQSTFYLEQLYFISFYI